MKRLMRIGAFTLLCAILLSAPWAIKGAVVDVRERIRPKDERWHGVVSVGVVPTFPMERAESWLKTCAKLFAEENDNVLVTVREMTKMGMQTSAAAQTLPDVMVFGKMVLEEGERKAWLAEESIRPIAAGAYALLGNRALLEQAGWREEMSAQETLALEKVRVAVPKREYGEPMAALRSMGSAGNAVEDLYARVWPDFALEGKYALYVATQREIMRMQQLRSAGRGGETVLIVPEKPYAKDQTLMCASVRAEFTARQDDAACTQWADMWMKFLEQEAQQAELAQAGLFSVQGDAGLYAEGHPLYRVEELMPACGRLS